MNTTTILNNNERKFLVQSQGFGTQKDIFCNLHDIPFILSEYFEKHEEFKVFEYWNRKLKQVSKKRLIELYQANQINYKNVVKSIDISAYQWFDKVNGNSYFAGKICVNFTYKNQRDFVMNFQYGYGDQYIQAALDLLLSNGYFENFKKYDNGGNEGLFQYCKRNNIVLNTKKDTGCKKSELKNI
jgi:hypothetical protein